MRILLDEDVPRRLGHKLVGHEVSTVQGMGWAGVKNGILLGLAAAAGFEVLLTGDRGMQYQQNVPALGLAVAVLAVPNKKLETIDEMRERLDQSRDYTVVLLRVAPSTDLSESRPLIWEHGRRNFVLRAEGILPIVLRVADDSDWAGVGIFNASPEETERILAVDVGRR